MSSIDMQSDSLSYANPFPTSSRPCAVPTPQTNQGTGTGGVNGTKYPTLAAKSYGPVSACFLVEGPTVEPLILTWQVFLAYDDGAYGVSVQAFERAITLPG